MDRKQIQEIILKVLSEYRVFDSVQETGPEFPVEISARHVHLTDEAVEVLFGKGKKLTPKRPLSQPGQFLSEERVTVVTNKGRFENVAVLGPTRPQVQTELSATDARALGISAPLKMSGDLEGAADVYIIGPAGIYDAKGSAIVAQAHIHMTPDDAAKAGVSDGQSVSVAITGDRPITFNNVICRVSSSAGFAMHIDYDEANCCMLSKNAKARISIGVPAFSQKCCTEKSKSEKVFEAAAPIEKKHRVFDGKLITESVAKQLSDEKISALSVKKSVIITPSAKDIFRLNGIEVLVETGR